MSTKIYDGVRFPRARLGEFVECVTKKGREKILRRARELVEALDMDSEEMQARVQAYPGKSAWEHRVDEVMTRIGRAADESIRNPFFDMECGWRVWVPTSGRWILAKPYGEGVNQPKLPEWVQSYGYWDNTDPEEGVSDREWERRKKDWDIACRYLPDIVQMVVEVFAVEKRTLGRGMYFWWLDGELRRANQKKPKKVKRAKG